MPACGWRGLGGGGGGEGSAKVEAVRYSPGIDTYWMGAAAEKRIHPFVSVVPVAHM